MPDPTAAAVPPPTQPPARTTIPRYYVFLPERLVIDMGRNTLAIGLYLLIGRLWHAQAVAGWVTLSDRDIQLFDPTLGRGAIRTALAKLVTYGWLIAEDTGYKRRYCPTWGFVRGKPRSWIANAPALGRPAHTHALRVDQQLLDRYLGQLTTRPTEPAAIKRLFRAALLSLRDVGAYGRTLAGVSTSTPRLLAMGLIADGQALAVPLLPLTLSQASTMLTRHGVSRLNWLPASVPLLPQSSSDARPDVFFVDQTMALTMIATMTAGMTATMVGANQQANEENSPIETGESALTAPDSTMTWTQRNLSIQTEIHPSIAEPEVVGEVVITKEFQKPKAAPQKAALEPPSWTAVQHQLLDMGVSSAKVLALHDAPPAAVAHALEQVAKRAHVRDRAAYIVGILEGLRSRGWQIPADAQAAYVEPDWSTYTTGEYAEFFRRDIPTSAADLVLPLRDAAVHTDVVDDRAVPPALPVVSPPTIADIWRAVQRDLERYMGPQHYRDGPEQAELVEIQGSRVVLGVRAPAAREALLIRQRLITGAFEPQLGYPVQLEVRLLPRS